MNSSIGQHQAGHARILGNAPKNWRNARILKQANSSISQYKSLLARILRTRPKTDVMRLSWSKQLFYRSASFGRCAYLGERAQKLKLCACLEASELFCQSASVGTSAFLGERNKKLTPCVYLIGPLPIKVLLFAIQHQLEQARILSKHAPKMWRQLRYNNTRE